MEIKCEYCGKIYSNKGYKAKPNLEKHLIHCLLNPKGIKYKCDKCDKEYDKRHSLIGHKKNCGKEKTKYVRKKKPQKTNCNHCGYEELNPCKLGYHISRCLNNPNYDKNNLNFRKGATGRIVKEETKKKISKGRIKFLEENPNMVPYLLNHSSKESYPEKYFTVLFEKEGIKIEKNHRIGLYELDFFILDSKIDLEIDGDQHYLDNKIVESDKRRTKFLEDNGWKIIRIKWSEYKSKSFEKKMEFIKELKNRIYMITGSQPDS